MKGDGTCDEACNVEECSYDLTDCCSCADEELGQCKTECLNASCAYDAGCDDDFMKDSAKYQQLIKHDFSAQLDFQECYDADSTCTLDDLRAFYTGEVEDSDKCTSLECFSQYGQGKCCPDEMHCNKCIGERCLECAEGYVNYYTSCVETCPLSYTTQSKVPGICFRKRYSAYTDNSSEDLISVLEVGSLNVYGNLNKHGLAESLAKVWQAYASIVLTDQVVDFSALSESFRKQTSSVSVFSPLQKTVSLSRRAVYLESFDCVTYPVAGCLEDWAEIRVTDRRLTLAVEGFKLSIYRVKITGYFALKSTCADVTCSYCPYLKEDDGFYFDDRHNKYAVKPDWGECEDSEVSFFTVDCGGKLQIEELKLYNFRLKQSAFIKAYGRVSIEDVLFENISSADSSEGFIVQKCGDCPGCYLELEEAEVKYFNNGYEIREDLQQSSFLTAVNSQGYLEEVLFTHCVVHSSNNSPLISLIDPAGQFGVWTAEFSYIAVTGPLISVTYSAQTTQALELDEDNFSLESTLVQLEFKDVRIEHVTAEMMVYVYMQTKLKNISMSDFSIADSVASSSLVYLTYLEKTTALDVYGGTTTTLIDGRRKAYHVSKITGKYHQITITDSYWNDYAFKSSSLVNEKLSSVTVTNSGKYAGDLRDFTYRPLSEDPAIYLSILPVLDDSVECQGTLFFKDSYYLTATNLAFDGVTCSGNTGLEASVLTDITVDILTSSSAVYETLSTRAAVLSLTTASTANLKARLSEITVKDLKSEGGGAINVSELSLTVKNSAFSSIVANNFSGLTCNQCGGFALESSTFRDLSAVTGEGACVYLTLRESSVDAVQILYSSFHQCRVNKYQGAAISLGYSSNPVNLTLRSLKFTEGSSLLGGSALYIGSSFIMTDLSVISDCTFAGHRDQGASLLELTVGSTLAIKNCHFTANSHQNSVMKINYSLGNYQLSLANCTFTNNTAETVVDVQGKAISQVLSMDNCTLSDNQAYYVKAKSISFLAQKTTFTRGLKGIEVLGTSVKLVSTTFSDLASRETSAFEMYEHSSLECEACTFIHNSGSSGGCIRVDSSSRMTVKNSKFSYNTGVIGSVFYIIDTKFPNLVQDSEISFNHATSTSTIQVLTSSLTLQRVNLHSNTAQESPSISAQSSDLSLLNCTLASQAGKDAAFVTLLLSSALTVQDSSISDGQGSAIVLVDSALNLTATTLSNIHSRLSSLISSAGVSKVVITSCQVDSLTALKEGSFIYSSGGSVEITSTRVSHFNSTALVVTTASKLELKDSVFENGTCPSSCVAILQDISSIQIIDSQFRHNQGSAALSITDANESSDVTIKGSIFEHNAGTEGGALKLSVRSALVSESVFLNNTSETDGGGISALCARVSCNYTFTHNNFTLNSAKHNGGAINWLSQPILINNSFTNNSAAYGPDLASFGVALSIIDSYAEGKLSKEIEQPVQVASGQKIPTSLRVGLVDHYDKLVKTDNSSIADVKIPDDKSTSVKGKTRVSAVNGVYEFDEIILVAKPGSQVTFQITTDAIRSQDGSDEPFTLPVAFRECFPGESQIGNSCEVCTAGSYSLDPSQGCTDCPKGAVCYGGSLMVPKAGYWRSSKTSDEFMECLVPSACLGSPHIVPSLTGECLRGYRGNLCQACANGYSRTGTNECGECPSRGANIARLFGLLFVVTVVCTVLVRSSLKTAYIPKAQHSIYLKIFANYLQLVTLVNQLSLEWPSFVMAFFEAQSFAGSVDQHLLSFDCYFAGEDPQGDSYKEVYYDRLVFFTVLPLIISSVVLAFWLTVYYFNRRKSIIYKELVATAVVLFFLVHPSLVKEYFAFFSCRLLDGSDLWLTSNLDIKCWEGKHLSYAFSVALPAILVWGLGVPSFILAVLFKRRRSLGTLSMKCRFGFFYNGFKKTHFYWEFLILYRKILIICLAVFVGNQSIPIQTLSIMLIILIFLALQFWQQPYTSTALNTMELKAIFVSGITIYCGLYYLAGSTSEGLKVGLFFMIVSANCFFFYYFLQQLLKTLLQLLATNLRLFKPFAFKEDSFSTANIASANFTSSSAYLEDDNSGKLSTICPKSEQVEDRPNVRELNSLSDFFESVSPTNSYRSRVAYKEESSTSRSLDPYTTEVDTFT
jgi:hypothetical protein